jgi:hypothetical protein
MMLWTAVAAAEPDLSGTWVLAEEPTTLARTHAVAVDDAVASLGWVMRPLARPLLRNSVNNCDQLTIALSPDQFTLACDDRPPLNRARGAESTTQIGLDGDTYALTLDVTETTLQLTFDGERGGQKSHFRREGDHLILQKQIFSTHLPEPIRWEVKYSRQ